MNVKHECSIYGREPRTFTDSSDAVEHVARLAVAAVGAQSVDATVSCAGVFDTFAFVNVCEETTENMNACATVRCCAQKSRPGRTNAAGAVVVEVIPPATVHRVPLALVGAGGVDAHLPPVAWARLAKTFVDI